MITEDVNINSDTAWEILHDNSSWEIFVPWGSHTKTKEICADSAGIWCQPQPL